MSKRLPAPRSTLRLFGSNGYTLEVHDIDAATATAVIVGTATGKRHANVTLTRVDLQKLAQWVEETLTGPSW